MTLARGGRALLILASVFLPLPAGAYGGRYMGPVREVSWAERSPEDLWSEDWATAGGPTSLDSWRFAWHAVENGILEERRVRRAIPRATVEERILPALRSFAGEGRLNFQVSSAAILGLARNGAAGALPEFRTWAWNRDEERRRHKIDEESSVLALGLLDDPDGSSAALLRRIAADREAKHRSRAFAGFALAFRGRAAADAETLETLRAPLDSGEGDLPAAAAFALGRMGGPGPAALLLQRLAEPRSTPRKAARGYSDPVGLLRSHAAAALGRAAAGTGPAVEEPARVVLLAEIRTRRRLPAMGAVVGLGRPGARGGRGGGSACVESLDGLLRGQDTEPHARLRAAMALAEIGARGPAEARTAARAALADALENARPDLSSACLALGLALRDASLEERTAAAARILVHVGREGSRIPAEGPKPPPPFIERAGGGILALGLLGDRGSRQALERILADPEEEKALRACAAEALGLLGEPASLPLLRRLAADRRERSLRRELAVALGLLGDGESVEALLAILTDPKSSASVLGGCSQALGWLADAVCVDPLLAVARDDDYPDLTRAFAVQTLGRMASCDRRDPFASLTEDGLYRACNDALCEFWTLL